MLFNDPYDALYIGFRLDLITFLSLCLGLSFPLASSDYLELIGLAATLLQGTG